jgi:hypothetical protein
MVENGSHLLFHEIQSRPRPRLGQLLRRKKSTDFGDSGDSFACSNRSECDKSERLRFAPNKLGGQQIEKR